MPEVRPERSHWRDERLSLRHRLWGFDAPCVDVDWLVIEYDQSIPIALIDYKESSSPRIQGPLDANARAIANLANYAKIPAYAVRYRLNLDKYEFYPIPYNESGERKLPAKRRMNEVEFVTWIYELRGRQPDANLLKSLA